MSVLDGKAVLLYAVLHKKKNHFCLLSEEGIEQHCLTDLTDSNIMFDQFYEPINKLNEQQFKYKKLCESIYLGCYRLPLLTVRRFCSYCEEYYDLLKYNKKIEDVDVSTVFKSFNLIEKLDVLVKYMYFDDSDKNDKNHKNFASFAYFIDKKE